MRNSVPSSPVSPRRGHPVTTMTANAVGSDGNQMQSSESPSLRLEQDDRPTDLGVSPSTETPKKGIGLFRSLSKIMKRRKDKPSSSKSPKKSLSLGRNSKRPENPLDTEFDENDPFAILQRQNDSSIRGTSTSAFMMASFSSIPDITDMNRSATISTNNNRSKSNLETAMSMSFSFGDTVVRASSKPLEQAQKKQAGAAKQEEQQQVHDVDGLAIERVDRDSPLLTNTPQRDSNTKVLKTPPPAARTSSGGGLQTLLPPFGKSPAREPITSSMGNGSSSNRGGSAATAPDPGPLLSSNTAAIENLPVGDFAASAGVAAAATAPVRQASSMSVGNLSVGNAEAAATAGAPLRQLSCTPIGNVSVVNSSFGNAGTNDCGRVTPLRQASESSTSSYNRDLPSRLLPQQHPTNGGSSSRVHRERNGSMTNSPHPPRSPLPPTEVYIHDGTNSSNSATRLDYYPPQPMAASHNFDLRSRNDDIPDHEGLRGLSLDALLSPRFDEVSARDHSSLLGHDLDNELRSGGGGAPVHHSRRSAHSFESHHPHHHHEGPPSRSYSHCDDRQALNAILSPRAEYSSSEYYNDNDYTDNNHFPHSRRDAPRDMPTGREYERETERGTLPPGRPDHVRSSSSSNNYDRYNGDNRRSSNGYGERREHHQHETARRDSYRDDGLDDLKSQMGGVRPYRGGGGGGVSRDGGSGFEPPPRFRPAEIEIAPGIYMPLRGSEETLTAIERGNITRTNCFSCTSELHCLDDAEYILCPVCRVVGPVDSNFIEREIRGYGVGLGVLPDQMRRWAAEIHRDRG